MYIPLDWLFVIAIILSLSIKILRGDERTVVLRLGHFSRIVGPGIVWLIPVIEKGIKVNLNKEFPGWQVLSKMELEEKIKASVLNDSRS